MERRYQVNGLVELNSLIKPDSKIAIYTTDKYGVNGRTNLDDVGDHMEPKDVLKWFHFCGPEGLIRANIIVGDKNGVYKGNVVLERKIKG